ncbi:hypothetical protein L6452_00013 [Arctium lappa]|uniref:Uncharacterized protein n=1 Tax=Arctium lappa TaxID=4217 RepID=A0ACB9FCN4_ARCLA|nr:hypothetical protein L6452_00013 [Arctium lappa]
MSGTALSGQECSVSRGVVGVITVSSVISPSYISSSAASFTESPSVSFHTYHDPKYRYSLIFQIWQLTPNLSYSLRRNYLLNPKVGQTH